MQGRLVAVAAIVIFLFAGIGAVQYGYWESSTASQEHVDFNESVTVNEGTVTQLANSGRDVVYAPQSDINVTQSGTSFRADGNWSWIRSNGTIRWADSSALTDAQTAHVEYYYTVPSTEQNVTTRFALLPTETIGEMWVFGVGIMLALVAMAAAARVGR